jgi:hypothetical protein
MKIGKTVLIILFGIVSIATLYAINEGVSQYSEINVKL